MAVNPQKLLPPGKDRGAIVKVASPANAATNPLGAVKVTVIDITKILKGSVAIDKKELDKKKRAVGEERKEEQEENLEAKVPDKGNKIAMPKNLPKMGFLEGIKNFVKNIILGYLTVRLIDHLPKLVPVITALAKVGDFLIDTGIRIFDGLATFVDWGYKAYDATRGFIKGLGGESFAKNFDKFAGAIDTTLFIATAVVGDLITGDSGLGDVIGDQLKKRLFQRGAQQAVASQAGGTATQAGGLGAGAVAGIVLGAGLLSSALGEGAFQLRKFATEPIERKKKEFDEKKWWDPRKYIDGAQLIGMKLTLGLLSSVGFLLDVVGAPFRYLVELLRYPFLNEQDKAKQAKNLAKFDARIREDIRKALNMLTLGFAFKEKGSFGNIYGDKNAQKEMMSKMAGGGSPATRGGKRMGRVKRTIGTGPKGKYKRALVKKPGKVRLDQPGADIGGKQRINAVFPQYKVIQKVGEKLDETKYVGSILAISSKLTLGQKPSRSDYENAALGINLLINDGIQSGELKGGLVAAFANGGMVDDDFLDASVKGLDVRNWIARTFRGEIETNAQRTLRLIKERKIDERVEEEVNEALREYRGGASTGGIVGSGIDKAVSVAKKLIADLGITPAQAAGIVGNFYYESSHMTPGEREGAPFGVSEPPWPLGTRDRGYGWAQWSNSRMDNFVKFYGGENGKIATDEDNYRFLIHELNGPEPLTGRKTPMPTDDPVAAAIWFRKVWERAGVPADSKRTDPAMAVFNRIKGTTREQARAAVIAAGGGFPETTSVSPGNGKFIQGNSGASGGVHFHIGPGTQPGQPNPRYNADARGAAAKVIDHFLGKKSLYDGRRGVNYQSSSEVAAAQRAHEATGGSPGGIDIQVGGAHPGAATRIPFPFAVTNMAERPGGFGVSAMIDGFNAFVAHGRYNESGKLATQLGTKNSPPFTAAEGYAFHGRYIPKSGIIFAHEGEYVIDKDSVNMVGRDFFEVFNDVENSSQMKQKANFLISRLSQYVTTYRGQGRKQTFVPVPVPTPVPSPQSQGGVVVSPSGSSSGGGYSDLYRGG